MPAQAGKRNLIGELSGYLKPTHLMQLVSAVSGLEVWDMQTLRIKATGRGSYRRTRLDSNGFPRGYLTRSKTILGFRTGDLVRAIVPSGKPERTREESR